LYQQATTIMASYTIAGGLLGASIGDRAILALSQQDQALTFPVALALVSGTVHYSRVTNSLSR